MLEISHVRGVSRGNGESNEEVNQDVGMGVTALVCIVHECQLRLHGHVTCYSKVNPAHWVVYLRDNPEWRRPGSSLPEQVDRSCHEGHGM